MNVSNMKLRNTAKCQVYSFHRFRVIKGKPAGGKNIAHPPRSGLSSVSWIEKSLNWLIENFHAKLLFYRQAPGHGFSIIINIFTILRTNNKFGILIHIFFLCKTNFKQKERNQQKYGQYVIFILFYSIRYNIKQKFILFKVLI